MRRLRAFTLIELLVVVTIITVLLAMILPAMNKAMYQASLTACAARLHATHVGITLYTQDFKRYYPNRKMLAHGTDVDPIKITGANAVTDYDDRIQVKNYLQLNKSMVCPLQDPIDLDVDPAADTFVYTGYAFWWGWHFLPSAGAQAGMDRLGDMVEFADTEPGRTGKDYSYSVLAGDHLEVNEVPGQFFYSTHPEKKFRHQVWHGQRGSNPWGSSLPGASAGNYVTISWFVTIYQGIGEFDLNYVMAAGEVVPVRDYRSGSQAESNLIMMPTFKNAWDRFKYPWPINPVPPG